MPRYPVGRSPRRSPMLRPPIEPMLARREDAIPSGNGWLYEPKWDGFRALVFFDGEHVELQSRDTKPLGRYFPELVAGLEASLAPAGRPLVLDGEVVVVGERGLEFDALRMRIHPAESRVQKLSREIPATFIAFDLLQDGDAALLARPFEERRELLEGVAQEWSSAGGWIALTPATRDLEEARTWFESFEGAGLDGIVAKRLDGPYEPGVRSLVKVKHLRTVDCVVAGLRWAKGAEGDAIGSLLLGLFDEESVLHYVGHTSSFKAAERRALAEELRPLFTEDESEGFGRGRTPGGPSRWRGAADTAWVRLRPERVCEVTFDQLQGARFRHASTFRRWRPDKPPEACRFDQLDSALPFDLAEVLGRAPAARD
ncbi:MAG: ATP-dependent DNA ligase [Dehalococcoidia bacterium]|nr:ATP-dependent DNA ligase [Dehalococcoidia bacterium]